MGVTARRGSEKIRRGLKVARSSHDLDAGSNPVQFLRVCVEL